jgi:hypothetical protein
VASVLAQWAQPVPPAVDLVLLALPGLPQRRLLHLTPLPLEPHLPVLDSVLALR